MSAVLPSASEIVASPSTTVETSISKMSFEELIAQIKLLTSDELMKVMKQTNQQVEKHLKNASKTSKSTKTTKKATKSASVNPDRYKHLEKSRNWIKFVLNHATQNGWKSFEIKQNKTVDKVTGEKKEITTPMAESVCIDGVYYYSDSIDEKTGKGKVINYKHAMTLSKLYYSKKDNSGLHPELYEEFCASQENQVSDQSSESSDSEKPAKSDKDNAKALKQAKKEAEEAQKAADKLKAANTKKQAKKEAEEAKKKSTKATKKTKEDVKDWVAPEDGEFKQWSIKGALYSINNLNHTFRFNENGGSAEDWVGIFNPENNTIQEADLPEEYLEEDDD